MPRATPEFKGRIKYNFVVTDNLGNPNGGAFVSGNFFKIDQFYSEVFISDTNNILYETNGDAKVIPIEGLVNITNKQMFYDRDKFKLGFFKKRLEEPCYSKAGIAFKLVVPLNDATGQPISNAEYLQVFDINDEPVVDINDDPVLVRAVYPTYALKDSTITVNN